jgi:hypothetical protein
MDASATWTPIKDAQEAVAIASAVNFRVTICFKSTQIEIKKGRLRVGALVCKVAWVCMRRCACARVTGALFGPARESAAS